MFCYPCEQTKSGTGCTSFGVCGKDPVSAALQNLLIYATRGIAMYAYRARQLAARDRDVDRFIVEALFTTVTNVNFDPRRLGSLVRRAASVRDQAKRLADEAARKAGRPAAVLLGPAAFAPAATLAGLLEQEKAIGVDVRRVATMSSGCRSS